MLPMQGEHRLQSRWPWPGSGARSRREAPLSDAEVLAAKRGLGVFQGQAPGSTLGRPAPPNAFQMAGGAERLGPPPGSQRSPQTLALSCFLWLLGRSGCRQAHPFAGVLWLSTSASPACRLCGFPREIKTSAVGGMKAAPAQPHEPILEKRLLGGTLQRLS